MAPEVLPVLIASAALLSTASGGLLFWGVRTARDTRDFAERFERLVRGESINGSPTHRDWRSILTGLGSRRIDEKGFDQEVPQLLARAGHRGRDALALFTALRLVLPLALTLTAVLLWVGLGRELDLGLLLACYAAFTSGYLGPKMVLRRRSEARARAICEEVSSLTHLMRVLYDCGLSTEQALQVFGREQRGVLPEASVEVGEVMRMLSAGSDLDQATREVAGELDLAELSDLFGLLRQIDRYGGSVQEPLLRFAALLEDRERTRLQEAISRLSAKLTVVMVLFLLPALLVFVGGPGFVAVIRALGEMNG